MKNLFNKYKEIITYVIFGVLTTLVNWLCYILLVNKLSFSVMVANVISWIVSVLFAYITNKLWVFESKSFKIAVVIKEFISFVASRAITGVLEIFLVPFLAKIGVDTPFYTICEKIGLKMEVFYTDGIYSKVLVAVIVVILNYVFGCVYVIMNSKALGADMTFAWKDA